MKLGGQFNLSGLAVPVHFRNFSKREIDGFTVWIAEPEKVLLDFWHLNPGEWSAGRMEEMRFQAFDLVASNKLLEYSMGYPPRVRKAVTEWNVMLEKLGD